MLNLMVNFMVVLGFIFPQPIAPESTTAVEEDRIQLLDKEPTSEVEMPTESESQEVKTEVATLNSEESESEGQQQKELALKQLSTALMAVQQEADSEVEMNVVTVNGQENDSQSDAVVNPENEATDAVENETNDDMDEPAMDSDEEEGAPPEATEENQIQDTGDEVGNQEPVEESTDATLAEESGDETQDQVVAKEQTDASEDGVSETEPVFRDYRQTFYSVKAGEVRVGYGLSYQDDGVKVIDNVMHYYDSEYEWLPIVAVNIDEVMEVGLNERGIPSYYGTVLEITYPTGDTQKAIVLDACGACSWDNRIDLWVYDYDYQHDVTGIEYRIVREGFKQDEEQARS